MNEGAKEILNILENSYKKISHSIESIEPININELVLDLQKIIIETNNYNTTIDSFYDEKFQNNKNIFLENLEKYYLVSWNYSELNLVNCPNKNN